MKNASSPPLRSAGSQWSSSYLKTVADYLRRSVASQDAISIERRVEIFDGKDAFRALLACMPDDKKPTSRHPSIKISSADEAKLILRKLLIDGYFIRAVVKGAKDIPLSPIQQAAARAEGTAAPPPDKIFIVEPDPLMTWTDDCKYIWIYEGSKVFAYAMAFVVLVLLLVGVMYPLWPYPMKLGALYLSMGCLCLIGTLVALSMIRLVLYVVSLTFSNGFWLFPNLFEDVGLVESFIPLYGWDQVSNLLEKTHSS